MVMDWNCKELWGLRNDSYTSIICLTLAVIAHKEVQ